MNAVLYTIETITPMHVGSGEISTSVIDQHVQRDFLTGDPTIYASSLKGALREHLRMEEADKCKINDLFGAEISSQETQPGRLRFFDASLVFLPIGVEGRVEYITCERVLDRFIADIRLFLQKEINLERQSFGKITINGEEGVMCKSDIVKTIFGVDSFIIMGNKIFKNNCDNIHLPVVARNCLKDGKSENLWYEQQLPRCCRFYFVVMGEEKEESQNNLKGCFNDLVQIGANASVGWGFCKINRMIKIND